MTNAIKLDGNCRAKLEKAISGALQGCIAANGPLTQSLLGYAAKRVVGAIKGYNKMAKELAHSKLRDKIISLINNAYGNWTCKTADGKSRRYERYKVSVIMDFAHDIGVLTDEQVIEVFSWESRWPLKPGPFRFGVDWKGIGS